MEKIREGGEHLIVPFRIADDGVGGVYFSNQSFDATDDVMMK